ncbi:tol-pal system protein YbgF [Rudaea sp.]|uniref:tol-pal system protein YbgF n=1 Tax=Rudaea sp. TaxID=2136325 RepID=UPI002ED249E0
MSNMSTRFLCATVLAAVAAFAAPAHAQRESLAERVARLEQQQSGGQGSVELVNQINALQSQVQQLQGQNEELKHQLEQLKQQVRDQAIDADSRLSKLEGKPPGTAPSATNNAASNNGQMQDIALGGGAAAAASNNTAPPPAAAQQAPAAPANPADEKAAYDQAFAALKDGRYAESAKMFQGFLAQYPNGDLAPNAYYWLGESYYVTQNYPISLDAFNKLLAQYPNSQKASAALLKVGYCQYELKQWDQAETTLNQVVAKYPGTQEANLAQGRLRALKMERR